MLSLSVVFLSDWVRNPYKELLIDHLSRQDVSGLEYYWRTFFVATVLSAGIPNVLHFHTIHPFLIGKSDWSRRLKLYFFIGQLIILRQLGVRAIWTVHEWNNKLGIQDANISEQHAKILGRHFDAIITHCHTTQREISSIFGLDNTEKVVVIPHANYIDVYENNISQSEARKKIDIPDEDTVFLLFGNIYRYKGVLESIDAFIFNKYPTATLVIAGSASDQQLEDEISTIAKVNDKIRFFPMRIPDEDVQLMMNAADCVLVPYQVFTTSGVAILAMSFSKACIAPNIGFFKDMLDEKGAFLYAADSEVGLQEALLDASQSRTILRDKGTFNFEIAKQWSWEYVAHETMKVYQKCCAK